MYELDLLKINAILHQFKGALPLLALSVDETPLTQLDSSILELRCQLLQVQGHLAEICVDGAGPLWDQMQSFSLDVLAELEQIMLRIARRWLVEGCPAPRPACLGLITVDPAVELGLP
ncbi:MAG: hypothetical protein ACAI44_38070 [Candidatus Sericytochromatia bacterium]